MSYDYDVSPPARMAHVRKQVARVLRLYCFNENPMHHRSVVGDLILCRPLGVLVGKRLCRMKSALESGLRLDVMDGKNYESTKLVVGSVGSGSGFGRDGDAGFGGDGIV